MARFLGSSLLEVALSSPPVAPPLTLIHRSAWNRNSRKFTCRILHIRVYEGGAKEYSPTPMHRSQHKI